MLGMARTTQPHASRLSGGLLCRRSFLGGVELRLDGSDHACRDLVLNGKDFGGRPVVALGPDVIAAGRVDELPGHTQLLARLADAALQHVTDAKLARDLANVGRFCPCRRRSSSGR